MLKPLFIDKIEKSDGQTLDFQPKVLVKQMSSPENIEAITQMLRKAVSEGTAKNIFTEHYEIAGKTGTARVEYWIKDQKMRYRASFAGFFPADNPCGLARTLIYPVPVITRPLFCSDTCTESQCTRKGWLKKLRAFSLSKGEGRILVVTSCEYSKSPDPLRGICAVA